MKKYILCLFIASAFILPAFSQDAISSFEHARQLYRDGSLDEALTLFLQFRENNPDSSKYDDALWYAGRIYREQDRLTAAERAFLTVLNDSESNRRTEAFYDLIRLYDQQNKEEKSLPLVSILLPEELSDTYMIKSLPVLMKSYSIGGGRYKRTHTGNYALDLWNEGIEVIDLYNNTEVPPDIREALDTYRIILNINILEMELSGPKKQDLLSSLQEMLAVYEESYPDETGKVRSWEDDIQNAFTPSGAFDYAAEISGVYNGFIEQPGSYAELDLGGMHPFSYNSSFFWDLGYKHDSFSFKTFNFNPDKIGTEQYFQWKEKINTSAGLEFGNPYSVGQRWVLSADVTIAEDPGDFSYGADLSGDFLFPVTRKSFMEWDNTAGVSIYPEYLNGTNELNFLSFESGPVWNFAFTPDFLLSAGYSGKYKYYLNAHYDTADGGSDPDTRQYFINSLSVDVESKPAADLKLSSGYELEYLKSYNYDMWIYGSPSNLFITDYFDYLKNTLYVKTVFSPGNYTGDIKIEISQRNFLNYEARDAAKTFTGEKRADREIILSSAHKYKFLETEGAGKFYGTLQFDWDLSTSNHEYETTYLTNYTNWQVMIGLLWKD